MGVGFLYLYKKIKAMTTIVINEKSVGAKKLVEYLRTQPFVTIVEEKSPTDSLLKSMEEAETGKTTVYNSTEELFSKLRKKGNV